MGLNLQRSKCQRIIFVCWHSFAQCGHIAFRDQPYLARPQDTSLANYVKQLQELETRYGAEYTELGFETENDCGCYHSCSCSPSLVLYGKRFPTKLERDFAAAEKARAEAAREAQERTEFERLAAKFGK